MNNSEHPATSGLNKWYFNPWFISLLCAGWLFVIPVIAGIVLLILRTIKAKKEEDFLREFEEELLKEDIPNYLDQFEQDASLMSDEKKKKDEEMDSSLDEMLANMPHREFKDLSVIYRMVVKIDGEGIASTPVHNGLADTLGFTEEQMFKLAAENTKRLLPPVVKSMNDVMREIFMKDGMPPEIADMMLGEMPPEQQMYVISNNKGINGAVSMLYEDGLHDLAEKLGSDLYIMPSSIHEVIAVSTDMGNPNELAAMVAEINMDQVALDERLSNQVYHYDKDLRKVTLATDTPNKRLDGIVAEAPMVYEAGKTR